MGNPRTGRPRASSLEMLAEAACELFLEQGYDATSIADIARRAGVGRSSFFNYASSKSGLLWVGFDARIGELPGALEHSAPATALLRVFDALAPDALALALANADAMGISADLEREAAVRLARIAAEVSLAEQRGGRGSMAADVCGSAYAGAVMTALRHWSLSGSGKRPLNDYLGEALGALGAIGGGLPALECDDA